MYWLIALQFAFPITSAYAAPIKKDVVIAVTYDQDVPTSVCVNLHTLDDVEMTSTTATRCADKIEPVAAFVVWPDMRIDEANFEVVVKYPGRPAVVIYLTQKINT